jgi:calcineurin-like phosphoesterase family protein
MSIFFTADPHFGHSNIIQYATRPFPNADEMNQAMINLWNMDVGAHDSLYCLGDWCMGVGNKVIYGQAIRRRLKAGRIVLIRGNHDPKNDRSFDAIFDEVYDYVEMSAGGRKFVLCHYAFAVWNGAHKGNLHLFGHSHGTYAPQGRSLDVGVDTHDFRVYSIDQVLKRLDPIPIPRLDHHA